MLEHLQELAPLNRAIIILVNLSQHGLDLVISDISLSQVDQDLFELSCVHRAVLVAIVQLEGMLHVYSIRKKIRVGVRCYL